MSVSQKGFSVTALLLAGLLSACGGSDSSGSDASGSDHVPASGQGSTPDTAGAADSADSTGHQEQSGGGHIETQPSTPQPEDSGIDADETPVIDVPDAEPEPDALAAAPVEPVDPSLVGCSADSAVLRQALLAVTNASRAGARQCGADFFPSVGALAWDDQLAQAALNHSRDMATINFFSHTGSDGLDVSGRATDVGFDWAAIGENIAAGQLDVAEVQQGWIESEGHCANIMSDLFSHMGAACVQNEGNTQYGTYWTVVLGTSF